MSDILTSPLFAYPKRTQFGRSIPKKTIYEQARVNTALKRRFIDQVASIRWSWKLSASNLNLAESDSFDEIHVLGIELKGEAFDVNVLAAMDRAIPHYTLFELHRTVNGDAQICVMASYKRPFKNDARRVVLSRYYKSPWYSADTPRTPLPTALNLDRLYEMLLMRLIPICSKPAESLEQLVARSDAILKKERELERLQNRLHREKQFNRKVELNQEVRAVKHALAVLKH